MELATLNQRFKNYLSDTFICGIITLILFALIFMIFDLSGKDAIFSTSFAFAFILVRTIYYTLFEYYFFRTIGKVITKTKVQTIDGSTPAFKIILIRSLCRCIPFNAFSFLSGHTGWHDRISKSCVVKEHITP